jgi:hypothetical protein
MNLKPASVHLAGFFMYLPFKDFHFSIFTRNT